MYVWMCVHTYVYASLLACRRFYLFGLRCEQLFQMVSTTVLRQLEMRATQHINRCANMCICISMYVSVLPDWEAFLKRAAGLPDSVSLTGNCSGNSCKALLVCTVKTYAFVCMCVCVSINNNNKSAVQSNNAKNSVRFWNLLYYFLLCFCTLHFDFA